MSRTKFASQSVAVLLACACGGAGVPDAPSIPPIVIPPTSPITPGGTTTTPQQRMAVLDAVQAITTSLPTQNYDANTKTISDLLKSTGAFSDVGSSADGTVWATFTSGQMVFVVTSGPPQAPQAPQSSSAVSSIPRSGRSAPLLPRFAGGFPFGAATAASQAPSGTVPKSAQFRLLNALGSYFSASDPRSDISAMLTANGYTGKTADATLSELRSVSGDGIFYIRAHGGLGSTNADGSTRDVYALWTSTEALDPAAENNDATLSSDLLTRRVVYMLFRNDSWSQAFPTVADKNRHYGITDAFISKYMTFADNSLIYIDACESANSATLRAAFSHGSVFAGWTERASISLIGLSSRYVFDRLIGSNTFAPEVPKQRPFDYASLPGDPKFGKGKAYGYSSWAGIGGTINAELTFTQLGGEFGILAPAISQMQVDDFDDQLQIIGYFGSDPGTDGKVTINDGTGEVALAVVTWAPDQIVVGLPRTGSGSFGNVVVSVRGHKSNVRQLLTWDGTLNYVAKDIGSIKTTFDLDVRMRLDPADMRLQIAQQPIRISQTGFFPNRSTQARYTTGGTFTLALGNGCSRTETWSGSGTLQAVISPDGSNKEFIYAGFLNQSATQLMLGPTAFDRVGLHTASQVACPDGTTSSQSQDILQLDSHILDNVNGADILPLPLDGNFNVSAGGRTRSTPSALDPNAQLSLSMQWSLITVRPTYDKTLPR